MQDDAASEYANSETCGSRCPTGPHWAPASGCRKMRRALRCPRCSSTCPIASQTGPPLPTWGDIPTSPGHGYAAVRVDLRGTGDSDGLLRGEYLPQEQDDALEVLAWLADQPWCSGAVGMIGYSWGGFNGLQIAARRPPQLKAVITVASTDDRYLDDCHYMGGCLLGSDMLKWAASMLTYPLQPPDPRYRPGEWREIWRSAARTRSRVGPRLGGASAQGRLLEARLGSRGLRRHRMPRHGGGGVGRRLHQRRPAPSRPPSGPPAGTHRALGAHDALRRGARAGHGLSARGRALVGSVVEGHRHGDHGGAAAARLDAGTRPSGHLPSRAAGALDRGTETWPPEDVRPVSLALSVPRDGRRRGATTALPRPSSAGIRCAGRPPVCGARTACRPRSRATRGRTTPVRSASRAKRWPSRSRSWGTRVWHLRVKTDRPLALVAARLEDVATDGASLLVSWGMLNLTQPAGTSGRSRWSSTSGMTCSSNAGSAAIASLPATVLRLALSPTYWPQAWPSPQTVTLTIALGSSVLELPVRGSAGPSGSFSRPWMVGRGRPGRARTPPASSRPGRADRAAAPARPTRRAERTRRVVVDAESGRHDIIDHQELERTIPGSGALYCERPPTSTA